MLGKFKQIIRKGETRNCHRPEVIVDFVYEDGLFFISIKNIGDRPALKTSVEFDEKIVGVDGRKEISALPVFRKIEFLAPQREIVTFLDTSASYFRRGEPTKVSASISYQDVRGRRYALMVRHDLEIYRNIGCVQRACNRQGAGGQSENPETAITKKREVI